MQKDSKNPKETIESVCLTFTIQLPLQRITTSRVSAFFVAILNVVYVVVFPIITKSRAQVWIFIVVGLNVKRALCLPRFLHAIFNEMLQKTCVIN